jgi:hypothetical protein
MDVKCELGRVNAVFGGFGNIVNLTRPKNFEFRSAEATEGGDRRFHWAKSIFPDSFAEIAHLQVITGHELNAEQSRFQAYLYRSHARHAMNRCTHTTSTQLAVESVHTELNMQVLRAKRAAGKQQGKQYNCTKGASSIQVYFLPFKKK